MSRPPKKPDRAAGKTPTTSELEAERRRREIVERLKIQSKALDAPADRSLPPPSGTTAIKDPLWTRIKRWLFG